MTESKLKQLRSTAAAVGKQAAALDVAGTDASLAKGELLAAVIDAIKPALRAICSKVAIGSTITDAGTTTEPASWRGLYLAGDGPCLVDRKTSPDGIRGRWGGDRLMLRADGHLVTLRYQGPWTNVRGEVSKWTAEAIPTDAVSATGRWNLDVMIGSISNAVMAQANGASPRRAAQLRESAERIRALVVLVQSWR
jgi:hypothetical protein